MTTSPRFMLKTDARAEPTGPYSASELRELAHVGMVTGLSLIASEGSARWVPAVKVKGLLPTTSASVPTRPVAGASTRPQSSAREPGQSSTARSSSAEESTVAPERSSRSSTSTTASSPSSTAAVPQPPKGGFLGRFARLPLLGSLGIAQSAPTLVGAGVLLILLSFALGLLAGLIPPDFFRSH